MSKPPRPRRALGAAASLLAGAAALPALAHVPAERAALEGAALKARVAAVRAALQALPAGATGPSWTLAQATNWTNWPKWSKWSNWANK